MSRQTAATSAEAASNSRSDSHELSIGEILQIFLQRKRVMFLAVGIALLLAALYLALATRRYTATATIEINKDNTMSLGLDDLSGIGSKLGTGTDLLTDMMTHQADLENETTALDVITRMHLLAEKPFAVAPGKDPVLDRERNLPLEQAPATRERAIHIFLANLKVTLVKNTRLISVAYTDTSPDRAAAIANTIVDVYLGNHTEARYAASLKTSRWLTSQLAELKDKVSESERRVSDFQQKQGLVGVYISSNEKGTGAAGGLPQVSSQEDERLMALNSDLTRAEVARIAKEALYRFAQTGDANVLASAGASTLAVDDAAEPGAKASPVTQELVALGELRQQQSALKLRYAAGTTKYGPKNPELLEVTNQITSIDEQIKTELARIQEQTRSDYQLAAIAERDLREQVARQEKVVGKLDQSVAGLLVLEQESASSRLLYQDMYTRLEEANLTAGLGAGVITIADPARPTVKPSSPIPLKVLALALIGGLAMGSAVALLLDQTQNILFTSDDFAEVLPAAQLGIIPDFGSHRKRRYGGPAPPTAALGEGAKGDLGKVTWLLKDPTSPISEAFRQLRTSILMSKSARPPRTLLFTSAISGDGKSVTSFNLATAFAYQGARVLLIDADMRRPTMHTLAGCSSSVGLSNVLTGSASVAEAVWTHPQVQRLSVLPAGTIPPMPAELLGSSRFKDLLHEFEQAYDYVLIDTPPLLLVTDPLLIAPMVEGVVLVARSGRDTKPALRTSMTMLNKPQVRLLGYVVNGISMTSTYYRYDAREE